MKKIISVTLSILLIFFVFTTSAAAAPKGSCGDKLSWTYISALKMLSITGEGDMYDYAAGGAPWYEYAADVESLSLAGKLTHIGDYAFYGFSSLTEAQLGSKLTSIGEGAFKASGLETLTVPYNVVTVDKSAFEDCEGLTELTFDTQTTGVSGYSTSTLGVQNINENAFKGCYLLSRLTLPSSLKIIGAGAFENCSSIEKLDLPDFVSHIGENAFSGCTTFTTLTLPSSLKEVSSGAFSDCYALKNLTVSAGTEKICDNAFFQCEALSTVKLPKTLKSIGNSAFELCEKISTVKFVGVKTEWDKIEIGILNECLTAVTPEITLKECTLTLNLSSVTDKGASVLLYRNGESGCYARAYSKNGSFTLTGLGTGDFKAYVKADHGILKLVKDGISLSSGGSKTVNSDAYAPQGDINEDGTIDINDVSVCITFLAKNNKNCDIDGDGTVTIDDVSVILLSANYAKIADTP